MDREPAISVSQLNRRVKTLLEQGIARLWVEGEISNLSRPASGHIYLTLKDDSAQVSAAWFRQRQRAPAHGFKNGDKVLAYGRVSLYEARGNFQLIIEQIEPAGEGVLKKRFDALKKKLLAEGLFDEDRKQALPDLPQRIGIITSPTGAAVRDMLTVLKRRFPSVPVVIYPAAVQGDAAPGELIAALHAAVDRDECDVIIMGRGGGSLEDLWAFNDEDLARAIAECPLPVISAVGHEVDFTIADFVADVRAPTPSGAAELVVPDQDAWLHRISVLSGRIARVGQRAVEDRAQTLDWLSRRLAVSSPQASLLRSADRLSSLRQQLMSSGRSLVAESEHRLERLRRDLVVASRNILSDTGHRLALLGRALHSVSPLATLDRGYAIVKSESTGKVLMNSGDAAPGDDIRAHLAKGELVATVKKVEKSD
ncbi:MAG: exodeoxyribonuclease VII large subunit [Pseudomonadota bacterium]